MFLMKDMSWFPDLGHQEAPCLSAALLKTITEEQKWDALDGVDLPENKEAKIDGTENWRRQVSQVPEKVKER